MTKQEKLSFADKALTNFKILLTTEGLLEDIQVCREKWKIEVSFDKPIIGEDNSNIVYISSEKEENDAIEKLFSEPPTDWEIREEFNKDIDILMNRYHISLRFFEIFRDFVKTGNIDSELFEFVNDTGASFFVGRDSEGYPFMAIKIYPETTIKDLEREMTEINAYRNKLAGLPIDKELKQNDRPNIDRDLRIYQLRRSGLTGKQIMNKINQEYPGKVIGDSQVYKILAELKKALSSYRRNPRMG